MLLKYLGERFDDHNCKVQCDNCQEYRPQILNRHLQLAKIHEEAKYIHEESKEIILEDTQDILQNSQDFLQQSNKALSVDVVPASEVNNSFDFSSMFRMLAELRDEDDSNREAVEML